MGRGKLTADEVKILRANPWVDRVDEYNSRIVWKESFKKHFIEQYTAGKMPLEIFNEAGFSKEILGSKRIERAASRWREVYHVPVRKNSGNREDK